MDTIIEKWQNRWISNEVIVLVLASLGIQIGLVFLAPLRKRFTNVFLRLIIWLLYLTADYVAILALGNISNQANPAESGDSGAIPGKLTVLWAPFLLLHLGGPDSITSYSPEDNELWGRHLSGLVVQVITTVYVFWQSPPKRWMWIPTMLVFIPGLIKFGERTHALRLGSKDYIKSKIISGTVPKNYTEKVELSESEKESQDICEGYHWCDWFKRLFVDITFSSNLILKSQERFSAMSARDALNLVSIELSFMYDILHTKEVHMHYKLGCVLRCISLVFIIAALVVFFHLDKQNYASKDIIITYILLDAGIILEVIAVVLVVSSDWTVVSLRKKGWRKCIAHAITKMVKRITLMKGKSRWSKAIGQYNLVGLCLRERYTPRTWIMKKLFKLKHIWDNMYESKFIPLPELLEDIMFTVAIRRSQNVHIYRVLVEARAYRGGKSLERHYQLDTLEWTMKRDFDESIILWHLATDICYYKAEPSNPPNRENQEPSNPPNGENQEPSNPPNGENPESSNPPNGENRKPSNQPNGDNQEPSNQPKGNNDTERDVSWKTSNYMVYLLTQQQSMMQLAYSITRFEGICTVVKKILQAQRRLDNKAAPNERQSMMQFACSVVKKIFKGQKLDDEKARRLLYYKSKDPVDDKIEDQREIDGQILLRDCHRLAEQLLKLKPEIRWKLISETWMEMLGYAAIHCDSYQHAKSLRRGGELLTHLWLLMSQLGVVEENKIQQYQSGSV